MADKKIFGSERNRITGSERNKIIGFEKNRITDFGEKIGGAKKDLWKKRGLEVSDLSIMNELEMENNIKKNNVWPTPKYQELLDSGYSNRAVYFIKVIKDAAPTKPVITYSDKTPEQIKEKQEGYVKFMSDLKKAAMNIRSDDDVLNFYEDHMGQYLVKNGRYVEVTKDAYGCIDNKLLKAAQVRNFYEIDRDIQKKQFLFTEEEKILSNFMILKYDNAVTFDKDYKNRTVMHLKYPGGTMFFYPKEEYSDLSKWEENKYFIIRGRDIYANNIESEKEAKDIILSKETTKAKEKAQTKGKKKYKPPQFMSLKFKGPDYREGHDIIGDDYLDVLDFKGGEFGNWVNEKERQESLNYGYEALLTLADALDVDPSSISLNNHLSIAFGSRGSGSAVAHYEPEREVINLTKMNGAGSLAHEWGHAMDDILNKHISTKDSIGRNILRLEEHTDLLNKLKYKYADQEDALKLKDEKINKKETNIKNYIKRVIPDGDLTDNQKQKRDQLANNILNDRTANIGNYVKLGRNSNYLTTKSIEDLSDFKKEVTNRKIPLATCKEINFFMYSLNKDREIEPERQKVKTDFYKDAIALDSAFQKESKGYWQSSDELFARSFACYVSDRAVDKGIVCDYLTGHAEAVIIPDNDRVVRGFPIGEERQEINKAFDKLIDKYKELGLLKEKTMEIIIERDKEQLTLFDVGRYAANKLPKGKAANKSIEREGR